MLHPDVPANNKALSLIPEYERAAVSLSDKINKPVFSKIYCGKISLRLALLPYVFYIARLIQYLNRSGRSQVRILP